MVFMTLNTIVFEKCKIIHNFALFSLFLSHLIPIFINERLHTTILASEEGSNEHELREKIWLYGFDSVFSQVLVEFLFFVSFRILFLTAKLTEQGQILMPCYRSV